MAGTSMGGRVHIFIKETRKRLGKADSSFYNNSLLREPHFKRPVDVSGGRTPVI